MHLGEVLPRSAGQLTRLAWAERADICLYRVRIYGVCPSFFNSKSMTIRVFIRMMHAGTQQQRVVEQKSSQVHLWTLPVQQPVLI